MSTPYLGQIEYFAFSFAPKGWALCDGQLIAISSNQALFALLGTTYGGDGRNTFALPNLQGRMPIGVNGGSARHPSYNLGAVGGEEFHTLAVQEIPSHTHLLQADGATAGGSNGGTPGSGTVLGASAAATGASATSYGTAPPSAQLDSRSVGPSPGAGQPHENRMPYIVLNACIATQGFYPPRN